jgi:hypothetical protein
MDDTGGINFHFLFINKGKKVQIQVKTGEFYTGLFHTVSTEQGLGLVLKMARKVDPNSSESGICNFRLM